MAMGSGESDDVGLRGLRGIPDALMEAHRRLYRGYVTNLDRLLREIAESERGSPAWSEMKRRVGFELNGKRLHELYFSNLSPGGRPVSDSVRHRLSQSWKTLEEWREEFVAVGMMRGVGWAILYRDPESGALSNHWIGLHEEGHPVGFEPVLVMDVWEHAYTGMERGKYIAAFLDNVDWGVVESRLFRK